MADMTFTGRIPPKKNSRRTLGNGRSIPSEAHEAWAAQWYSEVILLLPEFHQPVSIAFDWWAGGKRSPAAFDLNNSEESILDLLVDAGRIPGDDWWAVPQRTSILRGLVRGPTLCRVSISPIHPRPPWADPVVALRDKGHIKEMAKSAGISQVAYIDSLWQEFLLPESQNP